MCKRCGVLNDIEHHMLPCSKHRSTELPLRAGLIHATNIDVRISDTSNAACITPSPHTNEKCVPDSMESGQAVWS